MTRGMEVPVSPRAAIASRMVAAGALAWTIGCGDGSIAPPPRGEEPAASVVVSEPVGIPGSAMPTSAALAAGMAIDVAYVSLPPGTVPGGTSASIRNGATGASLTAPVANGGFDPVAIAASVGDELVIEVRGTAGVLFSETIKVPRRRPPKVVRIDPPKGKTDVPLNSRIGIVFSEPIDPASLTTATVQLSANGAVIDGTVQTDASGLAAEFIPTVPLEAGTEYTLVVHGVRDRSGDALEAPVTTQFTTGSTVSVSALDGQAIAAVSTAGGHTCALTLAGAAYCWGNNGYGELGNGRWCGSSAPCPTLRPAKVLGDRAYSTISSGYWSTCAVAVDGTAYCWGANHTGQIGTTWTCSYPTSVEACPPVTTPAAVTGGLRFKTVAAGVYDSCGLTESGAAYCWGVNPPGTARLNTTPVDVTPPIPVIGGLRFASLSSAWLSFCGLTDAGVGYCWGDVPRAVVQGQPLLSLAGAYGHSCAVTGDGAAYCWGLNGAGQLGAATTEVCFIDDGESLPHDEPCATTPLRVSGGLTFSAVTVAGGYTCALTTASAAYCWGSNWAGQIGDGTTTSSHTPVAVAGGLVFRSLSAGGGTTCGITTDGALYCWGSNVLGALGDGTTINRSTPVRIGGPR
jgi:alpha-tubulin suppressor-like RCC1 family protein